MVFLSHIIKFSGSLLNAELMVERFCPSNKLLLMAIQNDLLGSSHLTGNMFSLVMPLRKIHIKMRNDEHTIETLTPN